MVQSQSHRAVVSVSVVGLIVVAILAAVPASAGATTRVGDVPVALAAPPPLELTLPPVVSGTPAVGERFASTTGTWNPRSVSISFQWLADGVPIAGAN